MSTKPHRRPPALATWRATDRANHLVGDTIYISTANSRRLARVIATKPGWILLSYSDGPVDHSKPTS